MNSDDTTLYRMYDQWDRLLYVGITSDVPSRFRAHRSEKPWWTDIATIKLAHFPERGGRVVQQVPRPLGRPRVGRGDLCPVRAPG